MSSPVNVVPVSAVVPVTSTSSSARTKDLITLYRYKRTFLMIDEWGLYFLLIGLFYTGFPMWLISSILFYGATAIYTSYKNLDKIEQQIVPVDQEIHALRDIAYATLVAFKQIQDYFSMERQSVSKVQ
jgi:hypothetical protein